MDQKKFIADKKKIAFVASGGAVKAACFHIGVCLALEEKGFYFKGGGKKEKREEKNRTIDTYVGSSAGAMIVSFLAAGYPLLDIINSFMGRKEFFPTLPKIGYLSIFHLAKPSLSKYFAIFSAKRRKITSWGIESFLKNNFIFSGIFSTVGIENYLRTKVLPINDFTSLAVDLFIVATQLDYSQRTIFGRLNMQDDRENCVYVNTTPISQAVAASLALPPLYQPYLIKNVQKEDRYHYDGEIRETLSSHVAKDLGADLIISSYSHQPYQYHPAVGSLMEHGISNVIIQAIYQVIERKIKTTQMLHEAKKQVVEIVDNFFQEEKLSLKMRDKLIELLEEKLEYNPKVDYIYIHPHPQDYELFFGDHFNLSPKQMEKITNIGYKRAKNTLAQYKF